MRNSKTMTFLRGLSTLAAAAIVLSACSGSSSPSTSDVSSSQSTVGDNANEEIVLTIYSGRSEKLIAPLLEKFTDQTGIQVSARYGDSGEMAALLLTEGNASPADVFFSQDAGALGAVQEAGLFGVLPSDVTELVAPAFRSADDMWVGTSGRVRVVIYNPSLVDTPPSGIDDLLDPKWSGKIGFAPTNASWQSFVTALRVVRGEYGAQVWLEGFAKNKPIAYEKNGVVRDAVNAGEVSLGLVNHYYLYEKIATEGQAAVVARNHFFENGDVGGLVNVAGVGVLAGTKYRDAALTLVKFLLSDDAQTYFATKTFEYPIVAGISSPDGLPSLQQLNPLSIDLSNLKSIEQTQQLLEKVGLLTR